MRITVENEDEILFELTEKNALAPTKQSERAIVFQALMSSLALISGFRPPQSSCATGAEPDAHSGAIEQYLEAHKNGIVVPLTRPRGILGGEPKS